MGETEARSSVLAPTTGEKAEFGAVKKATCPAVNRTTQPEWIPGGPQGLGLPLAQVGLGSPTQRFPTVPLLFLGTHRPASPARCPGHSPQPTRPPGGGAGWEIPPQLTFLPHPFVLLSQPPPFTLPHPHPQPLQAPPQRLLQVGCEADEWTEVRSWGENGACSSQACSECFLCRRLCGSALREAEAHVLGIPPPRQWERRAGCQVGKPRKCTRVGRSHCWLGH